MNKLFALHELGQSTWLNYLNRRFIDSGELRARMEQGIQGITANAAVFEACLRDQACYDRAIYEQLTAGTPFDHIHLTLMTDDVQRAADVLRPIFQETSGLDGFASLELDPALAHDALNTIGTARSVLHHIDRDNTMVEIPGTLEGCEAFRALTWDGASLNATYLFSIGDFERAAQAYICGLESYAVTHSVYRKMPESVASFSIATVDEAVNPLLVERGLAELQNRVGLALAKVLYARYEEIFSGPRWERLARKGARPMRPKWTRLAPADPALPPTFYVDALVGPDTVLTFNQDTLDAFLAGGATGETLTTGLDEAGEVLARVAAAGIDLDEVAAALQDRYLAAAEAHYQRLIATVIQRLPHVDRAASATAA